MTTNQLKEEQRLMNPETVQALLQHGCDPNVKRHIINVFYTNVTSSLKRFAELSARRGFTVEKYDVHGSADPKFAHCVEVVVNSTLDLDSLNDLTDSCTDISDELEASYDGWYTEV